MQLSPWIEAALPLVSVLVEHALRDDPAPTNETRAVAEHARALLLRAETQPQDEALLLAAHVVYLRRHFPLSITSWFRTQQRNANVGGHPQSQHLRGSACDLVLDDMTQAESFSQVARGLGLTSIVENTHIHIQLPKRRATDA